MEPDMLRSLENYLAERADRPFGDVETVSNRTLQPFSFAGQQAAQNLLGKARRALDEGDRDRARKFIGRAAELPFDDHEQSAPVAFEAHMELFSLVADTLEESEEDEVRWLDAAVDVLAIADESACCEIRDVLVAIDQDYFVSSTESSRISSVVAPIPERAPLRDLDLDATELGDQVESILAACSEYRAALEASAQ